MATSRDSMSSPHSSSPGSDTSLPHVPAPPADTQVILSPIVVPTPPIFAPCLPITAQLTLLAYNLTDHYYAAWAFGFELFLESHNLHHHLMDDPSPLRDPSYASWSQSDSAILGCFTSSSRALASLSRASSRRALFGKPVKQCMLIRQTSAVW